MHHISLRNCNLSITQIAIYTTRFFFQLCDVSAALVTALCKVPDNSDETRTSSSNVGHILSETIDKLCTEYEIYCCGVRDSIKLLTRIRKSKNFQSFLQQCSSDDATSISKFLQKPVEYVKNLTLHTQQLLTLTSSDEADYENLQEVVRALRRCTSNISQEYMRQSSSDLTSMTSRSDRASTQSSTCSQTSSHATSGCSVDAEVLDIQNRLLFSEHVAEFQLTAASRHLIYSGRLAYDVNNTWTQVYTHVHVHVAAIAYSMHR